MLKQYRITFIIFYRLIWTDSLKGKSDMEYTKLHIFYLALPHNSRLSHVNVTIEYRAEMLFDTKQTFIYKYIVQYITCENSFTKFSR